MNSQNSHIKIAIILCFIAACIIGGVAVAYMRTSDAARVLSASLDAQRGRMRELIELTDRNEANVEISGIVRDCARRNEYESLLSRLGSLRKNELVTVQSLYENCGSYYAERKALMVMVLEQELAHYADLVALFGEIRKNTTDEYRLPKWRELVELEKIRSGLLHDQVAVQEKIISLLITGVGTNTKDVQDLANEAQGMAELLSVHDRKIDALREELR